MDHKSILTLLLWFLFLLMENPFCSLGYDQLGPLAWVNINGNVFDIEYVLPLNMSSDTEITMDVVLPEDTVFQEILMVSSEPSPNSTFYDPNGRRRLRYELNTAVPKFLNITIHYRVIVLFSSLTKNHSGTVPSEDIPAEIQGKYTKPAPYIESDDPSILGNATKILGNVTNVYSKVTRLFNFVSNRTLFEYNESVQDMRRNAFSHIRGALWTLKNRKGVCFDFAHLFVALLRAEGIPSRVSEGIILDGRSGFVVHDWVEVYFAGIEWVPFDPTWNVKECNIHMKILDPSYDEYVRWNYTIQNGQLYNFPEDSLYAVNDQIYIQNVTYPSIVDSLRTINDSYLNLTRTLQLDNETAESSIYISQERQTVDAFYGRLQIDFKERVIGVKVISYYSDFSFHNPKGMHVQVSVPWNLIFSDSIIPSLGYLSCSYEPGKNLHFALVDPVLWIGVILILGLIIFVIALSKL